MMGNSFAGTVSLPVSPEATCRFVCRSNTEPWMLSKVRGRKLPPVSACSFISPGKLKLVGAREKSVTTVVLNGASAAMSGSAEFTLKPGTRGIVNTSTRAILKRCQRSIRKLDGVARTRRPKRTQTKR